MSNSTRCVLAGDIGGTNTRLSIFTVSAAGLETVAAARYPSQNYAALSDILLEFLATQQSPLDATCLGIAGPINGHTARVTNLPWQVDATAISKQFDCGTVSLLNDLQAAAWGLRTLQADDFQTLQAGDDNATGNAAIIAAGTGLGEAGLYFDGNQQHPFASEGGHTDFSPQTELDTAVLRFLARQYAHVSWERVLSGDGLVNLHACLSELRQRAIPEWLQQAMREGDPAAAISEAAQQGRDAICVESLGLFVHLYGVEAGNLALKTMATGGLYIGGGIAPKILPQLQDGTFIEAFRAKGRMQALMERIPVRVILNTKIALRGAAVYAASGNVATT